MTTKSISDNTLFYVNIILFSFFSLALAVPFWQSSFFENVTKGKVIYILLGISYLIVFIALPLWSLSKIQTRIEICDGRISLVDWFGLRRRTYHLPSKCSLTIKQESISGSLRHFPLPAKYYNFRTLYFKSLEHKLIKIQSRYYKNFNDLLLAIKKECK